MDESKKEEEKFFDQEVKEWNENISERSIKVAKDVIKKYKMGKNKSVLDVGTGTGVLYSILEKHNLKDYVGIDISPKMIEEFSKKYPDVDLRRIDFEKNIELDKNFDFVIVFDTIPHLQKIDMIFKNAHKNLKLGGSFLIVHSKTRAELDKHHKEIGHEQKEPIPTDEVLRLMSWTYGFDDLKIEDDEYFLFHVKKKK